MRNRLRIAFISVLFSAMTFAALHFSVASTRPTSAAIQSQDDSIDCALSAFNESIQERFKVIDRGLWIQANCSDERYAA